MHTIQLPKILFLALDIAHHYRADFFNTSDLTELANRYKRELVRLRKDKTDYRYLEDTRFGGLRGNFSTLLTWRGLVKRGARIVNVYSLGKDKRLINAVCKGEVILRSSDFTAHTKDNNLAAILSLEAKLLTIRETQAHVKVLLKKNPDIPLTRDHDNFPKESVFKSTNSQYFIRGSVNTFLSFNGEQIQYDIRNLWEGTKFNKKNLHLLIGVPVEDEPWGGGIYAIKNEDLLQKIPFLLNVNLRTKNAKDPKGNTYPLHNIEDAIKTFSKEDENISARLNYSWDKVRSSYCEKEVDMEIRREDEFSIFLKKFLQWNREFSILGKDVADVRVVGSGGPDVDLIFAGGTKQKLELEHTWASYLDHGHHKNIAFKGTWIFSEEEFNFKKILTTFTPYLAAHQDRIPCVFLCVDRGGRRQAYEINWGDKSFREIALA